MIIVGIGLVTAVILGAQVVRGEARAAELIATSAPIVGVTGKIVTITVVDLQEVEAMADFMGWTIELCGPRSEQAVTGLQAQGLLLISSRRILGSKCQGGRGEVNLGEVLEVETAIMAKEDFLRQTMHHSGEVGEMTTGAALETETEIGIGIAK